ncbi:MAG: YhjD/YihY/BrkB family envelope integrity protein [Rubrivivax sp.]
MPGFVRHLLRRARQERLLQAAGSLTLTTVLSMVPLAAVGFALFERLPLLGPLQAALRRHLLEGWLPPAIAHGVLEPLQRFAANASHLPLWSAAFLLLSALAMLLTAENALNRVWNVKRARPWPRRLAMHGLGLLLGPPLLGLSLWATSALLAASRGWIEALPPTARVALEAGPPLLGWAGFAAVYYFVPNTRVRCRDAALGGLIASLALEGGKRAFAAPGC